VGNRSDNFTMASSSPKSSAVAVMNQTTSSSSAPQIVMEGPLLKQGSRTQQFWHERYFAFYSDHTLKYYSHKDDSVPKRVFNISQLADCEVSDLYVKKRHKELIYCVKLTWSGDASTVDNSVDSFNIREADADDFSSVGEQGIQHSNSFESVPVSPMRSDVGASGKKKNALTRLRKSASKKRAQLMQSIRSVDRESLTSEGAAEQERQRRRRLEKNSASAKLLGLDEVADENNDVSLCEDIPTLVEVDERHTANPQNGELNQSTSSLQSFVGLSTPRQKRDRLAAPGTPVTSTLPPAPLTTSNVPAPATRTPYELQKEEEQRYLRSQFLSSQKESKRKTKQMLVDATKIAAAAGAAVGLTFVTAGIGLVAGLVILGVGAGVSGGGVAMGATLKQKVNGEIVIASPDYDTIRMWKACLDASRESISLRTSRWGQLFVSEGRTTNAALLPPALDFRARGKEQPSHDRVIRFENTARWEPIDAGLVSYLWSGMNGLRLFREERDESRGILSNASYDGRPCPPMKVQTVVGASPLDAFLCLMSFGRMTEAAEAKMAPNSEQRSSFRILQSIDDHADIIHLVLRPLFLFPSWTAPRDFVLFRYWRLEQDGSYVVCYESMNHASCPPLDTHVRADMHQVITIAPQKKSYLRRSNGNSKIIAPQECYVTAVTQVDPKGWVPIGRIPFFPNQAYGDAFAVAVLSQIVEIRDAIDQDRFVAVSLDRDNNGQDHFVRTYQTQSPLALARNQSADSDQADDPMVEDFVNYDFSYAGREAPRIRCNTDEDFSMVPPPLSHDHWAEPDSNSFRVRGATYLTDREKINAGPSVGRLVAADVVIVDEPLFTGFSKHPTERIQLGLKREERLRAKGMKGDMPPYIFVVNVSLPGPPFYHGVYYFAIDDMSQIDGSDGTPTSKLCKEFFFGDSDEFRDKTFKMIPQIVQGNFIVRKAVGSTPAIMGKKLRQLYVKGDRFFEVILDCGSSSVATGVIGLSLGYAKTLVIDMGFLFEGDNNGTLPERIMGCVRMKQIDFGPHLRKVEKPPIES